MPGNDGHNSQNATLADLIMNAETNCHRKILRVFLKIHETLLEAQAAFDKIPI